MRPGGVAADMVEWRSREKIDGILEETLADPAVLQRTYPMGWYGKDRTGRPVRYDCCCFQPATLAGKHRCRLAAAELLSLTGRLVGGRCAMTASGGSTPRGSGDSSAVVRQPPDPSGFRVCVLVAVFLTPDPLACACVFGCGVSLSIIARLWANF